ncbi:hypothetical protein SLNSH_10195 [Alsobacter soli]|uniref:Glycosyltransferase family 1 protein n=1 Tax=Alsobacter soli TaxID=2109933 RepID=A0A2T1HU42_9HYPH|nr:hypothetical protein [Alsobacter soli]PSC05175.1 hypothetical protein SLNSH_10195 [Alsobacter soli]
MTLSSTSTGKPLLLCFSHRRWREQDARLCSLMTRAAGDHRVLVFEEPILDGSGSGAMECRDEGSGVAVATPHLPPRLADRTANALLRKLLDDLMAERGQPAVIWIASPAAMAFSSHLNPDLRIYDCAEDLAARPNAPATLPLLERRVIGRVDVVFAATRALYDRQKARHGTVRLAPNAPTGDDGGWDALWKGIRSEMERMRPQGARAPVRHTRERVLAIDLSEAVGA